MRSVFLALAATVAALFLAACGGASTARQPCRNLVENANWEDGGAGWRLPAFARLEEPGGGGARSIAVDGNAEGAVAQLLDRPRGPSGEQVVAVAYARVESAHGIEPTDEDVTPQLWQGAVSVVNGYMRWLGGFESIYVPVRFTGREAASGAWKQFVSPPLPVWKARRLYPHFAFWGTRLAPGVRIHLAGLAVVEAGEGSEGEVERAAACPGLPAPEPVLVSVPRRQWNGESRPAGRFGEEFELAERAVTADPGAVDLVLRARYQQGSDAADRFLVAVTDDGSDPRLSPTSRVETILAKRGAERWETVVRLKKGTGPLRIALAAAALTAGGLRVQPPVFPPAWQRPRQ